jgi:hypothetical protein
MSKITKSKNSFVLSKTAMQRKRGVSFELDSFKIKNKMSSFDNQSKRKKEKKNIFKLYLLTILVHFQRNPY